MTITREQISDTVNHYLAGYPADTGRLAPLREALHIHHKTLGKWLIPGGHLEAGDASLPAAALRELAEETAVTGIDGEMELIDIDVHPIPANPSKGEGAHHHFDFRFLARARGHHEVTLQAEEVTGHRWMPVQQAEYPAVADRLAARHSRRAGAYPRL